MLIDDIPPIAILLHMNIHIEIDTRPVFWRV